MRVKKDCPIPGCHIKNLQKLSNHLFNVHKLKGTDRKYYLQLAKQHNTSIMKHGKSWRLIPAEAYDKLVSIDKRPKPPVNPDVAHLARKKQEVEQVLRDKNLTPHEQVERYHEAMEQYMPLYEKMVRPRNKPSSESSDLKNLTREVHNLVSELRGATATTATTEPYEYDYGDTATTEPYEYEYEDPLEVARPTKAKPSKFSPGEEKQVSPAVSPEIPVAKPMPRVRHSRLYESRKHRSASPAETRSGPLRGKVYDEMFKEHPKKPKADKTKGKTAKGLKWKTFKR